MQIDLVGMGPGNPELLTQATLCAISEADCLIGAQRLLESLASDAPRFVMTRPEEIAEYIKKNTHHRVCVLFSGDTGLYSGAKKLCALLEGYQVNLLPGVSSVQYFASVLQVPWQDWHIVSAHGVPCDVVAEVISHPAVCFLTGTTCTPKDICNGLVAAGLAEVEVDIGENLSYPQQRIVRGSAAGLVEQSFAPLSLVLCRRTGHWDELPCVQGFPDEAFLRGAVPMTKSEVRAVSLAKLALRARDVVYDIGAGTGSIAVEAALHARRGRVFAIECTAEGCALIHENAQRFHAHNLQVVQGMAPAALENLPKPEAVFIGGSKGALPAILEAVLAKNPTARFVVNAVTMQTLSTLQECARRLPLKEVEWIQLSVAKAEGAGPINLLTAQNPVFIFSAKGGAADD